MLSRFQQNVLMDEENHGLLQLFGPDSSSQQAALDDVDFGFQFDQHQNQYLHQEHNQFFAFGHENNHNENHIFRSDSEDGGGGVGEDDDDDEQEDDHRQRQQRENEARDRENMFNNIDDLLVDTERKLQQQPRQDDDLAMSVEAPPPLQVSSCGTTTMREQQQQQQQLTSSLTREKKEPKVVLGFDNEPLTENEHRLVLMAHLMVRRDERLKERVDHHAPLVAQNARDMNAFSQQMDVRIINHAEFREVVEAVRERQLRELSPEELQLVMGHLNISHLMALLSTYQWSLYHTRYQDYLVLTIGPSYHVIRSTKCSLYASCC